MRQNRRKQAAGNLTRGRQIWGQTPRKGHFSRVLRSSPACHTAKSRFASPAASRFPASTGIRFRVLFCHLWLLWLPTTPAITRPREIAICRVGQPANEKKPLRRNAGRAAPRPSIHRAASGENRSNRHTGEGVTNTCQYLQTPLSENALEAWCPSCQARDTWNGRSRSIQG